MKNKIIQTILAANPYLQCISFGFSICSNTVIIAHYRESNKKLQEYIEIIEKDIIGKEEKE